MPCCAIQRCSGFSRRHDDIAFIQHVAEIWLVVGFGAVIFRTVQLFFVRDVQTGLVWATKILTDPFHDIKLYHKAPFALMRGELIDPGLHLNGEETSGTRTSPRKRRT